MHVAMYITIVIKTIPTCTHVHAALLYAPLKHAYGKCARLLSYWLSVSANLFV